MLLRVVAYWHDSRVYMNDRRAGAVVGVGVEVEGDDRTYWFFSFHVLYLVLYIMRRNTTQRNATLRSKLSAKRYKNP